MQQYSCREGGEESVGIGEGKWRVRRRPKSAVYYTRYPFNSAEGSAENVGVGSIGTAISRRVHSTAINVR
jgi:hypothetical protein